MTVRRAVRHLGLAGLVLAIVLPLAACGPPSSVTFQGRGWGHGRGMGQWGALGYSVDHGWSGSRILDHFYKGTSTRAVDPVDQRVYLVASKGKELIVTQGARTLRVDGYGADVGAARVARLGSGRFRIWRGTSCSGPWTLVGDRSASEVLVRSSRPVTDDPNGMLQHCVTGGTRYYRGSLRAVDALGTIVTVNQVDTESLLRSVVPKEVSPSWADKAGGQGLTAVRAQAVAARSYARSGDSRWGTWATTCDSTSCQVYGGYGFRSSGATTVSRVEDPRTDRAVQDTAHQVRVFPDGRIARTEFSSSSGGWTAGGDFPAVVDDGDDHVGNANHTWSVTVTRAALEAAFDARQGRDMGTFSGFEGWSRNGLGAEGGRVLAVTAVFSGGRVTLTGEQLRALFGLKSTWVRV